MTTATSANGTVSKVDYALRDSLIERASIKNGMSVKVEGDHLVIRVKVKDYQSAPCAGKTGKVTRIIAGTGGYMGSKNILLPLPNGKTASIGLSVSEVATGVCSLSDAQLDAMLA